MVWNNEAPKVSGRFQWRASAGGRIHNVIVRVKGGSVDMKCKTMDLRQIAAGGEWLAAQSADNADTAEAAAVAA